MIKRTDEEVVCYHQKFRLIKYPDSNGYSKQCVDCFDTFIPFDKTSAFTTYEPEFFDDIIYNGNLDLNKERKNTDIQIIEPL